MAKYVMEHRHCEKLREDAFHNPLTGYAINPQSKSGIYRRLLAQCNKLEKGGHSRAENRPRDSRGRFLKSETTSIKAPKLPRALKPTKKEQEQEIELLKLRLEELMIKERNRHRSKSRGRSRSRKPRRSSSYVYVK